MRNRDSLSGRKDDGLQNRGDNMVWVDEFTSASRFLLQALVIVFVFLFNRVLCPSARIWN